LFLRSIRLGSNYLIIYAQNTTGVLKISNYADIQIFPKQIKIKIMRLLVFIALFSFLIAPIYSQQPTDSTLVKIVYTLSGKPDSNHKRASTKYTLDIGRSISKFYSYEKSVADSLLISQLEIQRNLGGQISINNSSKLAASDKVIYRSFASGISMVFDIIGMVDYRYIDSVKDLKWKLLPDTANILGYKCTKATTHFRGRNYEAWFAPDIPIQGGPYIYCGLPGLILNIKDDQNTFEFQALSIEQLVNKYPLAISQSKSTLISRAAYRKLKEMYYNNPEAIANSQGLYFGQGTINGAPYNPEELKKKRKLYNPIELE